MMNIPPKKYRSDFLKACTSLGKKRGLSYIPSSDCLAKLNEILESFRVEKQYHEFAWKYFGQWNVLSTDVIPLVMKTKVLSPLVLDLILEIMQIISVSPYDINENPAPNITEEQTVEGILQSHKSEFLKSGIIGILSLRIREVNEQSQQEFLEKEGRSLRANYQRRKIFRNKYRFHRKLFRIVNNLLKIRFPKNSGHNHEEFVKSLDECDFFSLLLITVGGMVKYISSLAPDEHHLYQNDLVVFLGVITELYREEDIDEMCISIDEGEHGDLEKYNRFMFGKICKQDLLKKRRERESIPSRHSRFGGHMVQTLSDGTRIGAALIGQKRVANPSANQQRYSKWNVIQQPPKRDVESIKTKKILRKLGNRIINEMWHPYFQLVKPLFFSSVNPDGDSMMNERDQSGNTVSIEENVWFLTTCHIILTINRYRDLKQLRIDDVVCVFQKDMVEYIFECLELFITQKFPSAQRDLVRFLRSYMCCLDDMYYAWNRCTKNTAGYNMKLRNQSTKVLAFIVLEQRRFNYLLKLLKEYKVSKNPKMFLEDSFVTFFYFFELIRTSYDTAKYHVRKQTRKQISDADDLLDPQNDQITHDEIVIMNTGRKRKKKKGKDSMEDEEEDEDSNREEAILRMEDLQNDNTKILDLSKLQTKFCDSKVLHKLAMCLESFLINSAELNYALYRLMKMIVSDLKKPEYLFQMAFLKSFIRIINDPYYRKKKKRGGKKKKRRRKTMKDEEDSDEDSEEDNEEESEEDYEKDKRKEVNIKLVCFCDKFVKDMFSILRNPLKSKDEKKIFFAAPFLWESHRHFAKVGGHNDNSMTDGGPLVDEDEDDDELDDDDLDDGIKRYSGDLSDEDDDEEERRSSLPSLFRRPQKRKKKMLRRQQTIIEIDDDDDDVMMVTNNNNQEEEEEEEKPKEKTAEEEVDDFMRDQEAISERLKRLLGKTKELGELRKKKMEKKKKRRQQQQQQNNSPIIPPPPPPNTSLTSQTPIENESSLDDEDIVKSPSKDAKTIPPPPQKEKKKRTKKYGSGSEKKKKVRMKKMKKIVPDFSFDEDEDEDDDESSGNENSKSSRRTSSTSSSSSQAKKRLDVGKDIERELRYFEEEKKRKKREKEEKKKKKKEEEEQEDEEEEEEEEFDINKWRNMLSPGRGKDDGSVQKKKKKLVLKKKEGEDDNIAGELNFDDLDDDEITFEMSTEGDDGRKRKREDGNEDLDKLKKRKKRKVVVEESEDEDEDDDEEE